MGINISLMAFRPVGRGGEQEFGSLLFLLMTRTGELYRICEKKERGAHRLYPDSDSDPDNGCFLCPVERSLFADPEIGHVLKTLGYRDSSSSSLPRSSSSWRLLKMIADEKPKKGVRLLIF
jgi:hypothetical protein